MSLLLLIISLYVYILSMKMCNIPPRIAFRICEVLFKIQEMFFSCLKVVFSFCKKCLFFSDIFFFFFCKNGKTILKKLFFLGIWLKRNFARKSLTEFFTHLFMYFYYFLVDKIGREPNL